MRSPVPYTPGAADATIETSAGRTPRISGGTGAATEAKAPDSDAVRGGRQDHSPARHGADDSLLRPTLGPVARTVAVASLLNGNPEVLDDGATIARRTIELTDPFESIGAMIVRHVAWRVHETVGDGATTAAVIATRLMAEAVRVIAAGASPVGVRRGDRAGDGGRPRRAARPRPARSTCRRRSPRSCRAPSATRRSPR